MKLKKLFKKIAYEKIVGSRDVEITGVSSNSKLVSPGNIFIAKKGSTDDGHRYITQAIAGGAVAVLTDLFDPTLSVPQVVVKNILEIEGLIADTCYESPSSQLFVVGITGTNGKTTTSYLVKHLLDGTFGPSGLLGTIEYLIGRHRYQATHTTPDVATNHKLLREMVLQGCKAGVMEVTSHALDQGRVKEIDYDVVVYTNLTQDHLDYHESMETYAAAKSALFRQKKNKKTVAVINADCPWAEKITGQSPFPKITYGISNQADLMAENLRFSSTGTEFTLVYKGAKREVLIPLVGRHNVYNTLAAIGVLLAKNIDLDAIVDRVGTFPGVRGRLEPIENSLGIQIYVDFAHTEDALRNVLKSLRELTQGKIFTVFGCGGNRDVKKRPLMAEAVEEGSDMAIVTLDNSRSEEPEAILSDILKGFKSPDHYIVELDRAEAIEKAVNYAKPGDTVLIAGKGHETSQVFATMTIPFDDRKIAFEACLKRSVS